MLFAIPVWFLWIGGTLLLFLLAQLLLSYILPDRAGPPQEPSDGRSEAAPAARWPRPIRPPKVTRRLILPRTDPYAPRPFVVYRRPLRLTRPVRTRPVRTRPVRTRPAVTTHPATRYRYPSP